MDVRVETITAQQAETYLKFNVNNRPLRMRLVEQYAKEMLAGNWKLTHQGVAFNSKGELLDGQHRLLAIVQSGVPVQMLVSRGVESSAQIAMDDHIKRKAHDALSLARQEEITASQVAVIRGAVELSGNTVVNRARATKQELVKLFDEFIPALEFLGKRFQKSERGVTSAPVQAAIALAWYYVKDLERLEKFCAVLTGELLPENEGDRAAVALREWLLKNSMQSRPARMEGFKKTQRSIVAFSEYKNIGKLYGTATYYPWPFVDPLRS